MPVSIRRRLAAAVSAAVCAAVFGAVAPQRTHAAPAYNLGPIVFGTGRTPSWTIVETGTHQQRTITPTGGGFDAVSMDVTYVEYSPDAQQAAFIAADPAANGAAGLWVASADGTDAHLVTNAATGPIAWSPDGTEILYASDGIQSIVAGGGTPPKTVVASSDPSCHLAGPSQVTSHNAIFYVKSCGSPYPYGEMFAYRPGDASPQLVGGNVAGPGGVAVSSDGSRIAQVAPYFTDVDITVHEAGGDDLDLRVASSSTAIGPVVFGPSGDIAFAYRDSEGTGIQVIADAPEATPRTVLSEPGGDSAHPISFLDWMNGSSNLPFRPIADRIAGSDRIATAIDASRWAFDTHATPGRPATVAVLTRDDLYPDALAGTALAIQKGGPLLLTPGSRLDPDVAVELVRVLSPGTTVYLLGGTAALSPAVEDAVRRLGYVPVRLGGADRYATAAAIATAISGTHPSTVLLATGTDFPDALTAGVAAGQERFSLYRWGPSNGGVVLLTDGSTMPLATLNYLNNAQQDPAHPSIYAIGGPAAAALRSAVPWWTNRTALVGTDRYDTAAKVATSALYGNGAPGRYTMATITTGLNFPDAMSGGALAGSQGAPLLLAGSAGLSPAEDAILRSGHLSDVAVVGGPTAVADRIFSAAADTAFGAHTWDAYTNRAAPPLR